LIEETRRQIEEAARRQQEEERVRVEKASLKAPTVPVVSLQAYAQALKLAWSDGALSKDENAILAVLRKSMGINDEEHKNLEQEVQLEIYLQAIVDSWRSGSITPQDLDRLDILRERFNISAEEHLRMEKQVRQEVLRQR
jgi:hypothetical protein